MSAYRQRYATRSPYQCIKVPLHLRSKDWMDLLSTHSAEPTHELVLDTSHVKNVLAKLESLAFIHTYIPLRAPAGALPILFELPRYRLGFELRDEQLASLEYKGYQLSQQQQMVTNNDSSERDSVNPSMYTLPNFQQYLLLQRMPHSATLVVGACRAESLMLVSVGQVNCNRDRNDPCRAAVEIKVDDGSNAELKVRSKND